MGVKKIKRARTTSVLFIWAPYPLHRKEALWSSIEMTSESFLPQGRERSYITACGWKIKTLLLPRLNACLTRESEMYGPPPRRKRNLKTPQVGLRKCIRPLLEWITPGQDGMRCALFSINWSVAKDYFRFRIWRAPGSTVVPSPHSPADLAGNHDLAVVARLQPHRPRQSAQPTDQDPVSIGPAAGARRPID